MRVFGLSDEIADAPSEDDVRPELYEIWPDNLKTLNVFLALSAQWEVVAAADGEMVRTRLLWESFEILMKYTNGIPRRERSKLFNDIRGMEKAALFAMDQELNKRRERREQEAANER